MAINITNYPYDFFPPLNQGGSVPFPNEPPGPGPLQNPPKLPPIQEPSELGYHYIAPLPNPQVLPIVVPPNISDPGEPIWLEPPNIQEAPPLPRRITTNLNDIGPVSTKEIEKDLEHLKWTDLIDFIAGTSITQVDIENLRLKDLGIAYGAATRGLTLLENAKSLIKKGVDVGIPHDSRHQVHLLGNRAMGDKKRSEEAEKAYTDGQIKVRSKYQQEIVPQEFSEEELNKVFIGDGLNGDLEGGYPTRVPQTKTSTDYHSLKDTHSKIETDLVTNKYLMVTIVSSLGQSVKFPFVVEDMLYSPESNLAAINVLGRNLQKYHFASSEDTLEMRIIWNQRFSFLGKQPNELLINRALKIASFAKKTERKIGTVSFNVHSRKSSDISLTTFPMFDPRWNYVLIKAPIKILETHYSYGKVSNDHFDNLDRDTKGLMLDTHIRQIYGDIVPMKFEQTLVLKRVSQTDLAGNIIYSAAK